MLELTAIIAITILAVISPGPDFAIVCRNSVVGSRKIGFLTAVGIALGTLVHVAYSILGIGLLISQSIILFNVLKLVGAGYLIYIGIKMFRQNPVEELASKAAAISGWSALRTGFFTNATNPKTTIFFVSMFVQVIATSTPMIEQIGFGLFVTFAHLIWFSLVAIFFSSAAVQSRIMSARRWIDRVFGGLLIFFGLSLAAATAGQK